MIWCLHGAVGQAGDWDLFSQEFGKKGKACRAVELWRFLECEGMSLTEWAAAFNAEVAAAGEKENTLVGYSLGGRLALHALLDAPDLWAQAVIISAHPGLLDERAKLDRMASDAEWAGRALTSDWSQFLKSWDAQGVLRGASAKTPDPRMRLVNRRRALARSFMEWSLGKQENLSERLAEIRCPLLWVTGKQDDKFTLLAREAVALLAKGSHCEIESGHRVPWEAASDFAEKVAGFLCVKEPSPSSSR